MELHQIIKKALITEKSTIARDAQNQYNFEVHLHANKIEISSAGHECPREKETNG
jgi:large subunit ribosomal protein L23